MTAPELLISSDSHVSVSHDAIKTHLATKYHEEYDGAVEKFVQRMMGGAGAANQAWATKRQKQEGPNPKRFKNNSRPGYHDGAARLVDMDLDGVQTEVIYSEVSGFRYLWSTCTRASTTRRWRSTTCCASFAEPIRRGSIVSYQIPIHDIDGAMAEVRRGSPTSAAKSLQLPVFPPELGLPDYFHERYDPLLAR